MKTIISLLILGCPLFAAFAQNPVSLTLEECIEIALENNTELKMHDHRKEAARNALKSSQVSRYPSFTIGANYSRLSDIPPFSIETGAPPPFPEEIVISDVILDYYSTKASFIQPVFTGYQLSHKIKIDKSRLNISQEGREVSENELIAKIEYIFWNISKLKETRLLLIENDRILKKHKNDAELLFREGLITRDALLLIDTKIASIRLMMLENEDSEEISKLVLRNYMGLSLDNEIELKYDLSEIGGCDINLTESIDTAIGARPEIRIIREKLKSLESALAISQSGYYPQLYLIGNYYFDRPNQRYMPSVNRFKDSWDVTLSLTMEVWNWGKTDAGKQEAAANYKTAEEQLRTAQDLVRLETTRSYYLLNRVGDRLAAAQAALEQAQESFRMASERFTEGLISNSDLLEIEGILFERQVQVVYVKIDYQIAKADFNRALGIDRIE